MNFINLSVSLFGRIYEMELRLQTPVKFRHPSYEALTWYASRDMLNELKGKLLTCTVYIFIVYSTSVWIAYF